MSSGRWAGGGTGWLRLLGRAWAALAERGAATEGSSQPLLACTTMRVSEILPCIPSTRLCMRQCLSMYLHHGAEQVLCLSRQADTLLPALGLQEAEQHRGVTLQL